MKNLMMPFKIVFMGTPDFAVPVLERLISDGYSIAGVVTQPDRKRGRGKSVTFSPVKEVALSNGLRVIQPERIRRKSAVELLSELGGNLFITCAYGQILSQAVLDLPEYGCINVHASLLPEYRGAAPIHRAVMNGDKITGVTTMMTDIGMDTGDMLLKSEVEITEDMTTGQLHDILSETGADLISLTLEKMKEGTLERIPQDDEKATHAPMLKKEESIVDWNGSSEEIHDRVRALNPWPGCFTKYNGRRLRLISSSYTDSNSSKTPGSIQEVTKDYMEVACGAGTLKIYELQFENKKAMTVAQCWHNIDTEAILGGKD